MKPSEYQEWMHQAFLYTEGVLATELASATRVCMTEEYVRSALLRGLIVSVPKEVLRVTREMTCTWSANPCFFDSSHTVRGGRPIQHDVGIQPNATDAGLACEVKWLGSAANSTAIAQDILKLALSRSVKAEKQAMRSYLLIGGTQRAISRSLFLLRKDFFDLKWSPVGRGGTTKPAPTRVQIKKGLGEKLVRKALKDLVSRGDSRPHLRQCPATWASLRASLRDRWYQSVAVNGRSTSWRLLLWELDHRGIDSSSKVDWHTILTDIGRKCQSNRSAPSRY